MNCNHINQVGSIFCSTCGATLENTQCHCGFIAKIGDIFCSRCGSNLVNLEAPINLTTINQDRRIDLDLLAQKASQENNFLTSTDKARVTQDDIRKLLKQRKKKF